MANYTEKPVGDFDFPNIDIIEIFRDGVSTGFEARTRDGFVMFDDMAKDVEMDPDTGEEMPVIYYYRRRGFPAKFDFSNFSWVAVPTESVDEKNIW